MNKKPNTTEPNPTTAPEQTKTDTPAPPPPTATAQAPRAPEPAQGSTTPAAAAPTPAPGQPPVPDMESRLAEATDKYLRARAEHDNYRKRVQRDMAELREQVKAMTVQEFLPVYDYLQIAMDHAKTNTDVKALVQGMGIISTEFSRALGSLGITPIVPAGEPFDPTAHEAVSQEPSTDVPAGRIVRVWKCGFRNGDRLLRPAAVVVSSGTPEPATKGQEPPPPQTPAS